MTTNKDGHEQCQVCHEWFVWWDLTVVESGVWMITCCEECSKKDHYFDQIVEVKSPLVKVGKTEPGMVQESLF